MMAVDGSVGITVDLVPNRMISTADAILFKDGVGLSILFGERIADDSVVFQETYGCSCRCFLRDGSQTDANGLPITLRST